MDQLVSMDHVLFNLLNGFAGQSAGFDYFVTLIEGNSLLRSSPFFAIFWGLWFLDSRPHKTRVRLIKTLVAVFCVILITKYACGALPFRARPLYTEFYHALAYNSVDDDYQLFFVSQSSFPSDTAGFFFALSIGYFLINRRLGLIMCAWTALWICLPRIYLGLHWPTDLLVAFVIAAIVVPLIHHWRLIERRIVMPVLAFKDAQRAVFYGVMFMVTHELAEFFVNIRALLHAMKEYIEYSPIMVVVFPGVGMVLGILIIIYVRRTTRQYNDRRRIAGMSQNFSVPAERRAL